MDKLDRVNYIKSLENEKALLLKKISLINNKINNQKNTCNHISVDLGYSGIYPRVGDEYCCLICGMGRNHEEYPEPIEKIVHAENFLPEYNIVDDEECAKKFEIIQLLALQLLEKYPYISDEDLVLKMNSMIEKEIVLKKKGMKTKLLEKIKN